MHRAAHIGLCNGRQQRFQRAEVWFRIMIKLEKIGSIPAPQHVGAGKETAHACPVRKRSDCFTVARDVRGIKGIQNDDDVQIAFSMRFPACMASLQANEPHAFRKSFSYHSDESLHPGL